MKTVERLSTGARIKKDIGIVNNTRIQAVFLQLSGAISQEDLTKRLSAADKVENRLYAELRTT